MVQKRIHWRSHNCGQKFSYLPELKPLSFVHRWHQPLVQTGIYQQKWKFDYLDKNILLHGKHLNVPENLKNKPYIIEYVVTNNYFEMQCFSSHHILPHKTKFISLSLYLIKIYTFWKALVENLKSIYWWYKKLLLSKPWILFWLNQGNNNIFALFIFSLWIDLNESDFNKIWESNCISTL